MRPLYILIYLSIIFNYSIFHIELQGVYWGSEGGIPLKEKLKKYATLFLATFQLSAFTFGGGFVIIPLIRKKFVEQLGWIGEEEMLDLAAIAQSSPGAIAVNISILVGYRVAGVPGALLTVVGTVTPPLIVISVISLFYAAFRDNVFVNMAMCGMLAGVAAVILDVVLRLAKDIFWRFFINTRRTRIPICQKMYRPLPAFLDGATLFSFMFLAPLSN